MVLAAILCITIVLPGLGAVAAQSTLHADITRKRDYYTLGDSVSYDESLRGYYSWDVRMRGETGTPVALEVLTQQPLRTDREPTREDSAYRYRWDLLDVTNNSGGVNFGSDLDATFQPGFDSQRTVSTPVLDHQVTVQTLQVKVTPRESRSPVSLWLRNMVDGGRPVKSGPQWFRTVTEGRVDSGPIPPQR